MNPQINDNGKEKETLSPTAELTQLMDSLEKHIEMACQGHFKPPEDEAVEPKPHNTSSLSLGRFLKRRTAVPRTPSSEEISSIEDMVGATPRLGRRKPKTLAEFISFAGDSEASVIEIIRRIAELCVIGENYVTNLQKEQAEYEQRRKEEWNKARDGISTSLRKMSEEEKPKQNMEKSQLFDIFLERNGMALLVKVLIGNRMVPPEGTNGKEGVTYLPAINVAVQALQSICILIQNVSRATSLYALLSNNHVNQLIRLELKLYEAAERHRIGAKTVYGTPAFTELTTHFVTFLKSLAMRMNAETLQFFLIFPPEGGAMEFPLYECSLKLCASQNDSFVRTTALNICLNTLRLSAVKDVDPLLGGGTLEFRERVSIAEYACVPATVEQLIAPVFSKLAAHWSALDESIRAMDENRHMRATTGRNERVVMAKEKVRRERLIRNFQEAAGNLQDELYLLDDIFKVGLTVLNEQLIEMMLATFVYPLLLQPLTIYAQHLETSVTDGRLSLSKHPFGGIGVDMSDLSKSLIPVSGPAKASLFTLTCLFQCLSNKPLFRLVFTALFHPLSPDTSKNPTLRSKLQIATKDANGVDCIRVDSVSDDERQTYEFGTDVANRRESSQELITVEDDPNACMFVLSPALAEVLEYRGEDYGLLVRTRTNPYRQALLACLQVPADMEDVRKLAACTFDGAVSALSDCSHILYGTDMKRLQDDTPLDEQVLDSKAAHSGDDRGLGITMGDTAPSDPAKTDFAKEIVSALCTAVATASRVGSDEWKLEYDPVAAHALLLACRHFPKALGEANKQLEPRVRQAALASAAIPTIGLTPMGGTTSLIPGAPDVNADDYEERMFEAFLNYVFYDSVRPGRNDPIAHHDTRQLKKFAYTSEGYVISVSHTSDPKEVSHRLSRFLLEVLEDREHFGLDDMIDERRESASVWLKLDTLHQVCLDLTANPSRVRSMEFSSSVLAEGDLVTIDDFQSSRSFYAGLSPSTTNFLYQPMAFPTIQKDDCLDLTQHLAISCVCEVSGTLSQFFRSDGVEAEGVAWHPLLLVFVGYQIVFCHPDEETGRVIASCDMERLTVERDPPNNDSNAARRLTLAFKWFDLQPPPLFLFDAIPEFKEDGAFVEVTPFTSRLDVWLENETSMRQAFDIVQHKIFAAKCHRGKRIKEFLDPNGEIVISGW